MNHAALRQLFYRELTAHYLQGELQALYHWCAAELEGWSRAEAYTKSQEAVSDVNRWEQVMDRLKAGEPVQYVFGKAEFMDLTFKVDERVLIPRPETEELVDLILQRNGERKHSVLDIGTGSGCIAIALKTHRPNWEVHACDVSKDALDVARTNAHEHGVEINFFECDVIDNDQDWPHVDIIVSNPPYIPSNLKDTLDANVRDYEPALALFAPERDPFYFYRRILDHAYAHGVNEVWFETHATDTELFLEMGVNAGFEVQLIKDVAGKERFASCKAPTKKATPNRDGLA